MSVSTDEVSKMDLLMSLFHNKGSSEFSGVVKSLTVRIPIGDFSSIEAFSRHTGMSKNKVIVRLLEVALDSCIKGLDSKNRAEFDQLQSQVLNEMQNECYSEVASDL
jgi:hypothetical protein